MYNENLGRTKNNMMISPKVTCEEHSSALKGRLIMKAFEGGELVHSYESPNIIVNTASILIARLLKDNSEPTTGISHLTIGSGNAGWDLFDPPAPTTSQVVLENEFYRKEVDLTTFVHPETGEPTTVPTNIVDYAVTFGESEAVGPIVEMGLFGGESTAQANTGTMINWRTFPVINKTSTMTLTIIFRITA